MKTSIITLFLGLTLITACKKDVQPTKAQATLIGYDYTLCSFCGGIKVVINNDTTKNPPPFYRIQGSISALGIPENTAFPVNIYLNWKKNTSTLGNYITVSDVTLRH